MGIKEWSMLIILSVLWGGSFFFVEIAVSELPTLTIVLTRVALAAVALWLFILITGIYVPSSLAVWGSFLIMGLLNNVLPFSLIVWGQTHIASGLASILNATTPLFTVLVASRLLQDEKITRSKLVGVVIGLCGTVIMIGPSVLDGIGVNVVAQLAVLGAALSYAFAGVYGRRFRAQNINPVVTAAGQVTASALVLLPVVWIIDDPASIVTPTIQAGMALAALALFSTAIAYVLYFKILASAGATNLLLVTFLIPVSAILLGTLLLGERLQLPHIVGMGIITVGLVAIDGRFWIRGAEST
ncbi:MAG: DMT family transporter [Thiotrichales bacterium]|jgi:drug/metabolite transporter (DMT)-like permease|nr:DMT family transporter [Thiotrichales bacterium]MBT3612822.1 DMT family transporter [Thiotrichales bacterium]MBT3751876.1 DMT family transporter [Thiotrichales bacterium]MBT3837248.1 DMT family transporter [Thiotrichales bacterium]MBT4152268.1 DMT family transporter [Thiotrichales bacterium]